MKSYVVHFTSDANEQIDVIGAWWIENRDKNPQLFDEELSAACERIALAPRSGELHPALVGREVRRVLLPRTGFHLFYEIDDQAAEVWIIALWHAARGSRPRM